MADYLRSSRNGSEARLEIVLNFQHKKLDFIKERVKFGFTKMKQLTQANELLAQCQDSIKLFHEVVLSLRSPTNCNCFISPRLMLERALNRDILLNKFFDSTFHKVNHCAVKMFGKLPCTLICTAETTST